MERRDIEGRAAEFLQLGLLIGSEDTHHLLGQRLSAVSATFTRAAALIPQPLPERAEFLPLAVRDPEFLGDLRIHEGASSERLNPDLLKPGFLRVVEDAGDRAVPFSHLSPPFLHPLLPLFGCHVSLSLSRIPHPFHELGHDRGLLVGSDSQFGLHRVLTEQHSAGHHAPHPAPPGRLG